MRHLGIGKALAKRLADQGLNVVLVALPDDILETTYEQLAADYPSVQFRKVCSSSQEKECFGAMAAAGLSTQASRFAAQAPLDNTPA